MDTQDGPIDGHALRGRMVELDTLEEFDLQVAAGARSMAGWRLQNLDLTARGPALRRLAPGGALFLGCDLTPADEESLRGRGALIFPELPGVPFDAYRARLYTAEELYAGLATGYEQTPDARIYAWSRQSGHHDVAMTLARALHDLAVDDALEEYVRDRPLVGVMGGHNHPRSSADYADAARLGRALAKEGLLVSTGGGPGSMEAANLGARAAGVDESGLQELLGRLGRVPHYRPSVQDWATLAFEILERLPAGEPTLGIPTWFYGHEPPNVFATEIAKYFRNALREDTLLTVCSGGIVFLPGAAGTVQEVFQDACENYYAEPASRTPMVLVGRRHWTETLPAWPLLQSLARARDFESRIHLVDSWDEVPGILVT